MVEIANFGSFFTKIIPETGTVLSWLKTLTKGKRKRIKKQVTSALLINI